MKAETDLLQDKGCQGLPAKHLKLERGNKELDLANILNLAFGL
jgi:hypothetical protein